MEIDGWIDRGGRRKRKEEGEVMVEAGAGLLIRREREAS